MVLLDTGTPDTSREIYSEDPDGEIFPVKSHTYWGHFSHGDNSHGPQVLPWQPFVMNASRNRKAKKTAYLPGYWLDLAQIW